MLYVSISIKISPTSYKEIIWQLPLQILQKLILMVTYLEEWIREEGGHRGENRQSLKITSAIHRTGSMAMKGLSA